MSISCDHMALEARSASLPPGSVDNKTSLLTRSGCLHSKVLGDESAHRPSQYAYTFEAEGLDHMRSVISELVDVEWISVIDRVPDPAMIEKDESLQDASLSMNEGFQSALVAAKPFRTRSGRPF